MRTLLWLFAPAVLLAQVNVPYERIRDADKEPGNWLTYSRDYSGQRYSPLDQIQRGQCRPSCVSPGCARWTRLDTFETSPIVVDGTLFITAPPNVVEALDAATGRTLWSYRKDLPTDLRLCCGKVNRGLAILGNTLYYASTDAHLIALDARTGSVRWDVTMADYKSGILQHGRAAGGEGQDHHRDGGRRVWHPRVHRRLRRQDRQTVVALQHHPCEGRTGQRDMGRR